MAQHPESSPPQDDEDFDISSAWSLASTAHDLVLEHGRRYANYRYGSSPFPQGDEIAEENEVALYNLLFAAYQGRLFMAPIEQPKNILDVRCGQGGLWAKNMADTYPASQVSGMEVTMPQTEGHPNLEFFLQSFNDEWILDEVLQAHGKFDFIFAKSVFGLSQDYPLFYKRCFENLAPGGCFEQCEIVPYPSCDDEHYRKNSIVRQLCYLIPDFERSLNIDYNIGVNMKRLVEEAGFIEVEEKRIRLPWSPWYPAGTHEHEIGRLFQRFYETGIQGWVLAPLCKFYNFEPEQVNEMCEAGIIEIRQNDQHFYSDLITITARKPLLAHD